MARITFLVVWLSLCMVSAKTLHSSWPCSGVMVPPCPLVLIENTLNVAQILCFRERQHEKNSRVSWKQALHCNHRIGVAHLSRRWRVVPRWERHGHDDAAPLQLLIVHPLGRAEARAGDDDTFCIHLSSAFGARIRIMDVDARQG